MRISWFPSLTGLLAASALSVMIGCMGEVDEAEEAMVAQNLREQAACGLNDSNAAVSEDCSATWLMAC